MEAEEIFGAERRGTTEPEPGPSAFARVRLAFAGSSRAFAGSGLARSWWAPYLLLIVLSLSMAAVIGKTVGWTTVARNNLAASPKQAARLSQLPADQQAAQLQIISRVTSASLYIAPIVAPLILGAIVAGLLLATFNFGMGAKAGFGSLFAVYMLSCIPQLVKLGLVILLLVAGVGRDTFLVSNPIGSNPGYYLQGSGAPHPLQAVSTWLDLFLIWQIVLLILGCAVVAKVSRGKAAAAILGWVVFFMLVTAGVAAL